MLAKTLEDVKTITSPPCEPVPDVDYSGFPSWTILLTEPSRERRAAEHLERLNIHAYLPMFAKRQRCGRGATHYRSRQCAVVPMTLFVPDEMLNHRRRNEILDWARLRFSKIGRSLTKLEVEIIREIEAKLNVRFDKKTYSFQPGQPVRFLNELWAAFFGEGRVIEVASGGRISVKVRGKLFGGRDTFWIPAAELEAM